MSARRSSPPAPATLAWLRRGTRRRRATCWSSCSPKCSRCWAWSTPTVKPSNNMSVIERGRHRARADRVTAPTRYPPRTSAMKVHHLNCGTMRVPTAPVVSHVLLIETSNGLTLVDSGFGMDDIADPARRIGPARHLTRPALNPAETAARQVERLGFRRDDVRHIILTHLDVDHTGGLSDFPQAEVHVTTAEVTGAIRSPSLREKMRYRPAQWAHHPKIVE